MKKYDRRERPQNENVAVRKDVQSMFFILVIVYLRKFCKKVRRKFAEKKRRAEALGGCRDMKERLTHRNTNQFFE